MPIHDLNADFLAHFKIRSFFKSSKKGGQKEVHFVETDEGQFALKLFHATGIDDRTKRELSIYEKFQGLSGIPSVYKIETYEGELVVFEEYINGDCLHDVSKKYNGDAATITALLRSLCAIMQPIWAARYVHRDIKPANIIIRTDSSPVLLDFGIARDLLESSITNTGFQPLSWQFGAPEQYQGSKQLISYRTDFFSLGALAYYLFYARLPFGNSMEEISARFQSRNETFALSPECGISRFCLEALKFSPAERPRQLSDLIALLP